MDFHIDAKLIHNKMDEYLALLKKLGIVTNPILLSQFYKQLHSVDIIRIYDAPGDAHVGVNKLEYCSEKIINNMFSQGEYYLDEVLFHEFTHLLNSFHQSIKGPHSFIISDALERKMDNFTNIELLENGDYLLYNQDPYLGVVLLDEYVAQNIAQLMVKYNYNLMHKSNKSKYARNGLREYAMRAYTTNTCIPPLQISTSLADYPEFDVCAKWFIEKYNLGSDIDLIKNSFNVNYLKNIIESIDSQTAKEMYVDLCYLGLIKERVAIDRGFISSDNPKDPVNDRSNIHKVFKKILKG